MPSAADLKRALRPMAHRLRQRGDALLGGNCIVLLYHRVIDLATDPQQLAVAPARFDAQLAWLKANCQVLTADEFDAILLSGKRFPRNSALITFDDGYADNHQLARPILERHALQGLFYIASGYIGAGREYWWDELERLLMVNPNLPKTLEFDGLEGELNWRYDHPPNASDMRERYGFLIATLRILSSEARDAILSEARLRLNSPEPRSTHLPMTRDELRAFASSPSVAIGAHTVGHCALSSRDEDGQRSEIIGSKLALEKLLDRRIERFAYPFGTGAEFNAVSMRICEQAGFLHAAANMTGIVHKRSPRFAFPRVIARDWEAAEFARRLRPFMR
jgi:peptidoglycan/xylan/chitin deacetylase (PgdA/CDA1 family)